MRPLARALAAGTLVALCLAPGVPSPGAAQTTRQLTPIAAPASVAPAPPDAPILRIDADFHTAVVNGFALDPTGRVLVTVSDDKTARVWQAGTGAPLATLRIPIGPGGEGALYAAAISPDGSTLLLGGNTGFAWDKAFCVYIFDLQGQKIRGRLPNLPGPINDIAYAPDGRSFALAMGNGGGVWLVDAQNGHTIASDVSFRQRVTSVAFDSKGRLYATGFDGEVHAYDRDGRRVAQRVPLRGGMPYRVAVSPDDRTVAVGYLDQPVVVLLDARDLSVRSTLNTDPSGRRQVASGGAVGLGAVGWTADGALLAAGSLRDAEGRTLVRHWGQGGAGKPVDVPGLTDTVFKIGPTPDNGAIIVGADPALVRFDRTGTPVYRKKNPGLDFRDLSDRLFRVSPDGSTVQLQTKTMDQPVIVDMGQRRVGSPTATRGLVPIAAEAASQVTRFGPQITEWRNGATPRLDGHPLPLAPEELARSVATAPSGDLVVLGTDYQIRVFRRDGTPLGQADLPGAAWAVAVSGDGRTVVAAVSDGTLRWFGLSDAGELTPRISVFLAADRARWIAWTAAGFFDYADSGGDGLAGVQLNHARNQVPEWFSFAQMHRRFFAPDRVTAALLGDPATTASSGVSQVRQELARSSPPQIELDAVCWPTTGAPQCQPLARSTVTRSLTVVAAASNDADVTVPGDVTRVTLRYRLRGDDAGSQVGSSAVDLFNNGHNAGREIRPLTAAPAATFEQPAAVDTGLNRLQLRAYDGQRQTYSESRQVNVVRAEPAQAKIAKPTLFLLSVGINRYGPGINGLTYAVPDAKAVAAAIRSRVPSAYGAIEEINLYDTAASSTAVLKALADIGARASAQDTVLVYLSGHGMSLDGRYYFITQDVQTPSVPNVTAHAISEAQFVKALAGIAANNTMLFLDTCHAGAFSLDSASNLAHETGRYILAAASSLEESLDSYDDHNGVFATAVLRGLSGKAAEGRPTVNNFELGFYVQPLVRVLAQEAAPNHRQSARFKVESDNAVPFPITAVQ